MCRKLKWASPPNRVKKEQCEHPFMFAGFCFILFTIPACARGGVAGGVTLEYVVSQEEC